LFSILTQRVKMESVVTYFTESPKSLLVLGAALTITYLVYRRQKGSYSGKKLPPALPSLPIVGSLPFISIKIDNLLEFCISPRNKLGKIFSIYFGPK